MIFFQLASTYHPRAAWNVIVCECFASQKSSRWLATLKMNFPTIFITLLKLKVSRRWIAFEFRRITSLFKYMLPLVISFLKIKCFFQNFWTWLNFFFSKLIYIDFAGLGLDKWNFFTGCKNGTNLIQPHSKIFLFQKNSCKQIYLITID